MGLLLSCAGRRPETLGVHDARLAPCPARPNCVCSDDAHAPHHVAPFELRTSPEEAWPAIESVVADLPRTTIVSRDERYLHAESEGALLGFVDDLELHLRPERDQVAVRSASRLGYSDLGVNRRRVEELRRRLRDRGVIR